MCCEFCWTETDKRLVVNGATRPFYGNTTPHTTIHIMELSSSTAAAACVSFCRWRLAAPNDDQIKCERKLQTPAQQTTDKPLAFALARAPLHHHTATHMQQHANNTHSNGTHAETVFRLLEGLSWAWVVWQRGWHYHGPAALTRRRPHATCSGA